MHALLYVKEDFVHLQVNSFLKLAQVMHLVAPCSGTKLVYMYALEPKIQLYKHLNTENIYLK